MTGDVTLPIVGHGEFVRHKLTASLADAVVAFAVGFVVVLFRTDGFEQDRPLTVWEWLVGTAVGVVCAGLVAARYRRASIAMDGGVLLVQNPYRTGRLHQRELPYAWDRRLGLVKSVQLIDERFNRNLTLVALPHVEWRRLGRFVEQYLPETDEPRRSPD